MSQAGGENWLNIASTTASQMAHFTLVTISLKSLNRQKKKKKKSYEQICTLLYLFEQMLLSRPLEATIFHFRGTTI